MVLPRQSAPELSANMTSSRQQTRQGRWPTLWQHNGVNFNLAPVVDLDLNPDNPIIGRYGRSFGVEPEHVVRYARAFDQGPPSDGIGCCLKHFPGHGSAAADSHLGFVDSTGDWQEQELIPFARLIAEGYGDAVMTAHVINRRLDPQGIPATLSRPLLAVC